MHILQILQDVSTDPSMYNYIGVGSGIGATAGTIITMLVAKWINKPKDKAEVKVTQANENVINYGVIKEQFESLWSHIKKQDEIILELQSKSCYREPCKLRINGNDDVKPIKPLKKKSA